MLAPTRLRTAWRWLRHPGVGAADDPVELGREPARLARSPSAAARRRRRRARRGRRRRRRAARSSRARRRRRRRGRRRPRRRTRRRRCCGRRRAPAARGWRRPGRSGQRSRQVASSSGAWSITRTISCGATVWARSDSIACRQQLEALARVGADHDRDRRRGGVCVSGGVGTAILAGTGCGSPLYAYASQRTAATGPTRVARMRILMLAQSFSPIVGGEERIVEDLSAELVAARSRGRGRDPAPAARRAAGARGRGRGSTCWRARSTASLGCRSTRNAATRRRRPTRSRSATCAGSSAASRPDVVHAHNWLVHSYLPLDLRSDAALVLSLHDYSLVCATKRFFYEGGVCSGPAAGKCLAHSVEFYGAAKGAVVAAGVRAAEPWLRRRVDMFLPVSDAVSELSGLDDRVAHRVVPNFIGELPAPPPAGDPRLAALPGGALHPLLRRRHRGQGRGAAGRGLLRRSRSRRRWS